MDTAQFRAETQRRIRDVSAQRGPAKPGHAARCECYAGHNSASGRCNARNVVDPTATRAGDPCWCESCRIDCHGAAMMNRNARINRE